ncbi:glycosyltransferase family 2 protein [Pedobacter nanyangensis]|uniref:glycosyltransferase family 2 protein n=1 Tax=Pedobacter nanyangensis TaxID=1562389 RepID=UPI000DE1D5CD|nr:glycosyltransferase family 2 protein [Pedobacter nanyangensis]
MNNKQPLVSIAVCTYNGERFLQEQLDSVIAQTYGPLEIVVVDDCSKDGTVNLLKQYEEKHPNFSVYYNDQNLGYIKNFEKAISLCNGDYIALCDQDDIWAANKIALQLEAIGDNMLIYHDSEFIDQNGDPLHSSISQILNMYQGNSPQPFLFYNCVSGHASLFKRELTNHCLPFPKGMFHDRWMAFVAANLGSISYIDQKLVKYRQHENSDTNILKIKRDKNRPVTIGRAKIVAAIKEMEIFSSFTKLKDKEFIEKLLKYQRSRLDSYLSIRLVLLMFANYKLLLYISKKGALSKFNFIFKHIWGAKIKKA